MSYDVAFDSFFSLKLPPTRFPVHRTKQTFFFSGCKCSEMDALGPFNRPRKTALTRGASADERMLSKGCSMYTYLALNWDAFAWQVSSRPSNVESQAVVSSKYSWTPTTPLHYHFWVNLKLGGCS